MFVLHATQKLLKRLGSATAGPFAGSTTAMGSWYATALFWRPEVALFVNETTLLPVFAHLAPASTLVARFAGSLAAVLEELDVPHPLVAREIDQMGDHQLAKTANRSVVGIMNEFSHIADAHGRAATNAELLQLSIALAATPCGPLYSRSGFPDREVLALFGTQPR